MGTSPNEFAAAYEHGAARKQAQTDEQRQAELANIANAGLTPSQTEEAIGTLYKGNPSALKTHIENLFRRMKGEQPQDVPMAVPAQTSQAGGDQQVGGETLPAPVVTYAGAKTQADKRQQILSQGTTPEQRKMAEIAAQGAEKVKAVEAKQTPAPYKTYVNANGERQAFRAGEQPEEGGWQIAPTGATTHNIPGAAGQPYKNASGRWVRAIQGAGGIEEQPMPADWKPPESKPPSPSQQYVSLLSKKILAAQGKGAPLTDKENADLVAAQSGLTVAGIARANAWAAAAAQYNMVPVTDPVTGMDTLLTRAQAAQAAKNGHPLLAGIVSAPTGMDKKNQMLAQSAILQIDTMQNILKLDPNLTGPGAGQLTAFTTWLGSNSEDSQQFLAAATFLSEHGVGVFGGRNIHTIEDLKNVVGQWKTNPQALNAALDQTKATMAPWAVAGGRLPAPVSAPKKAEGGGGPSKGSKGTVSLAKARSLPQNKGKSDAEITADAKKHGYEVKP